MLQLSRRIVADPRYKPDLMIDEDKRCVFRRKGGVTTDLIGHCVLLSWLRLSRGSKQWGDADYRGRSGGLRQDPAFAATDGL